MGIDGGMVPRQHPAQTVANTIAVENVDASVAAVMKNGGPLAVPKMPINGMGRLACCTDTEGNLFGMMEMDPAAA